MKYDERRVDVVKVAYTIAIGITHDATNSTTVTIWMK